MPASKFKKIQEVKDTFSLSMPFGSPNGQRKELDKERIIMDKHIIISVQRLTFIIFCIFCQCNVSTQKAAAVTELGNDDNNFEADGAHNIYKPCAHFFGSVAKLEK